MNAEEAFGWGFAACVLYAIGLCLWWVTVAMTVFFWGACQMKERHQCTTAEWLALKQEAKRLAANIRIIESQKLDGKTLIKDQKFRLGEYYDEQQAIKSPKQLWN